MKLSTILVPTWQHDPLRSLNGEKMPIDVAEAYYAL